MPIEDFKKLSILERLKVQYIQIDHATAFNLYLYAKNMKEENLFFSAFIGALSNERISTEDNIYTQYFNGLNAEAYDRKQAQSKGGKNGKRSKAKPKTTPNETKLDI